MTDSFLCRVVSYDPVTRRGVVLPYIVENDGTPHPQITVQGVEGITPLAGDIVLVLTIRNNITDVETQFWINRFYEASETNGRIVAVVVPASGEFRFTGNYRFTGNLSILGNLTVTGNTSVSGNVSAGGDVSVTGGASITGALDVTGIATFGGIAFPTHVHNIIDPTPGMPTTGPL